MLEETARRRLAGTVRGDRFLSNATCFVPVNILQRVLCALRNKANAARDIAPVNSGGEFVIAGFVGLLERRNADHVQEHTKVTRFRAGCASDPRYPVN